MGAKQDAEAWAETVRDYAQRNDLRYEQVGGINPKDGPVALCVAAPALSSSCRCTAASRPG